MTEWGTAWPVLGGASAQQRCGIHLAAAIMGPSSRQHLQRCLNRIALGVEDKSCVVEKEAADSILR